MLVDSATQLRDDSLAVLDGFGLPLIQVVDAGGQLLALLSSTCLLARTLRLQALS